MKISLIIVAYNEEKYLGACLQSVIKNSKNLLHEIIVVDNNSTDNTNEIASSFREVKVIKELKKGASMARETGFRKATGDILAFLDADNQMPEGWVEKLISEFEKDNKLVALSGPYEFYDISKFGKFLSLIYWYVLAYPIYLCVGYMAIAGNLVMKKKTLEAMGGFDTKIFFGDDTNISRRASHFGKVKFKLDFIMYSSARRLNKAGVIKTAYIYTINFFSQVFIKKSVTEGYTAIR